MKLDDKIWTEVDTLIPGWMSKAEAEFLIENIEDGHYLEIGVAFGKSMRLVRMHFPNAIIGGIDLINHGTDKKIDRVNVYYGDANNYMMSDRSLDTLFIDGNHTYKGCLSDYVHWYNKVRIGGKIIFHDYGRPTREHEGVTQSVDAIKSMLSDFKSINYIACGTKTY